MFRNICILLCHKPAGLTAAVVATSNISPPWVRNINGLRRVVTNCARDMDATSVKTVNKSLAIETITNEIWHAIQQQKQASPSATTDTPIAATDTPNAATDTPNAATDTPNAATDTDTLSVDELWKKLKERLNIELPPGVFIKSQNDIIIVLRNTAKENSISVFCTQDFTEVQVAGVRVTTLNEAIAHINKHFRHLDLNVSIPTVEFEMLNQTKKALHEYCSGRDVLVCGEKTVVGAYSCSDVSKRAVHVVVGQSGAGKSTFACLELPKLLCPNGNYKVCHWTLSGVDKTLIDTLNDLGKKIEKTMTFEDKLRRAMAIKLLDTKVEVTSFIDPVMRSSFLQYYKQLLPPLEEKLKLLIARHGDDLYTMWLDELKPGAKYNGTLYVVIDEISKCLPLGRAMVGLQEKLYESPWTRNHFERIEFILCGTGGEELERTLSGSQLLIATDPRRIRVLQLDAPPPLLRKRLDNVVQDANIVEALHRHALFQCIEGNARLLAFTYNNLLTVMAISDSEKARPLLAQSITLFLRMALYQFVQYNGLGSADASTRHRIVDAALVDAIYRSQGNPARAITLMPLSRSSDDFIVQAQRMGVVVGSQPMSPAMAAVATFGLDPNPDRGEQMEDLCVHWVKRLLDVQRPSRAAAVLRLTGQVPTQDSTGVTVDELRQLVVALHTHRGVVVKNGPRAPGADVIALQLRPESSELAWDQDDYDAEWPEGVVARVYLYGCKAHAGNTETKQLHAMGVIAGGEAYRQIGPLFFALVAAVCAGIPSPAPDGAIDAAVAKLRRCGKRQPLDDAPRMLKDELQKQQIGMLPVLVHGGCARSRWKSSPHLMKFEWAHSDGRYLVCGMDAFGPLGNLLKDYSKLERSTLFSSRVKRSDASV